MACGAITLQDATGNRQIVVFDGTGLQSVCISYMKTLDLATFISLADNSCVTEMAVRLCLHLLLFPRELC